MANDRRSVTEQLRRQGELARETGSVTLPPEAAQGIDPVAHMSTAWGSAQDAAQRTREPHKPSVHVRVDGLVDEEMVRAIVREEIDAALKAIARKATLRENRVRHA